MPIRVVCPGCNRGINAPDTFAGKAATCPGCGRRIEIPGPASPPPFDPLSALGEPSPAPVAPPPPPEIPWEEERTFGVSPPSPPRMLPPRPHKETANNRYPHLTRYLSIIEVASRATLAVFALGLLAAFSLSFKYGGRLTLQQWVSFAVLGAFAYLAYLAAMASVQVIRVLIDIEANTRSVADGPGD